MSNRRPVGPTITDTHEPVRRISDPSPITTTDSRVSAYRCRWRGRHGPALSRRSRVKESVSWTVEQMRGEGRSIGSLGRLLHLVGPYTVAITITRLTAAAVHTDPRGVVKCMALSRVALSLSVSVGLMWGSI